MFQTARRLDGCFTAFGATPVALHSQLIFALPRDGQMCELVFNALSHFCSKAVRTPVVYQSSIPMTESPMGRARCARRAANYDATSGNARCQFLISAKRIENWELP
jgi:hypothetical protein